MKYWRYIWGEGAICGLVAGGIYFLFSLNLLSFPLGAAYGTVIASIIGLVIKPKEAYNK